MIAMAPNTALARKLPSNELKAAEAWQLALWKKWPSEADWPGVLDVFESAAFRRVHPCTIRAACQTDRKGNAKLPHQRFGAAYRIRKADLLAHHLVKERSAA